MKGYRIFYCGAVFLIETLIQCVATASDWLFDTFIKTPVLYVRDLFMLEVEKKSFAKNYKGVRLTNTLSFVKEWMYDMFSRWRVDPTLA